MANGDLLNGDFEFQLHNTLYGRGNGGVYLQSNKNAVDGIGIPTPKTQDVKYWGRDGSYGNPDYNDVRIITITGFVRDKTGSVATAVTNYKNLLSAWAPINADTDLAFQLGGALKFYVNGRPRGITTDMTNIRAAVIWVLLRFDCLNPTITYI
jgi:hypothetical protein